MTEKEWRERYAAQFGRYPCIYPTRPAAAVRKIGGNMAKTKKKNRRSRPPDVYIAAKRQDGYALAGDLAEELGIAASTIYGWASTGKLTAPPGKAVSIRERGCVWLLVAAVRARAAPVAKAAS